MSVSYKAAACASRWSHQLLTALGREIDLDQLESLRRLAEPELGRGLEV